ncbi:MAG TPA: hypothetical protein PL133_07280 [Methylophilaceae bacterium]|nr:hypothetical protein [Methylophilaceae bacterium]HQC28582.1 hypothetical protein [Methylotenera sp.]
MRTNDTEIPAEAKDAIAEGKLIQAIKITREKTGLGLKESKDLIIASIDRDPILKEKFAAKFKGNGLSQERIFQIVIITIVVVIGYLFFTGKV